MKTKLICIMLLIVAATTVTIISCKKQDVQIDAFTKITDVSSKIAKEWLINQKSTAKANEKLAIDSIMNVMNWTNGKAIDINKEQSLLYIPLSTKNNNIGISMYFNKTSQKIDSACLYLVNTKETFGDIGAANILYSYLTKSKFSFTGSITSYAIFNKYKVGQGYENGILKYTKLEKNKAKGATNDQIQTNGIQCYNRYLITYYTDGTQTEEFLYTWCEGFDDCQTTGTIRLSDGQQEIKTLCAGGGGAAPVVNECGMTEEEVDNALASINPENLGSTFTSGSETIDISTGIIRKPVQETWNFCKFTVLNLPVQYTAYFTGTIFKQNASVTRWKYENLSYASTFEEGTSGPCLDITTNTAINQPVISSDSESAVGLLSYNIIVKISCFGSPKVKTLTGNGLTANWSANH